MKKSPYKKQICMDAEFFEHLLLCMGNQRCLPELEPADRKLTEQLIEEAYQQGLAIFKRWKVASRNTDERLRRAKDYKPRVSQDDKEE